jgi:hypothetical protein
VIEAPFIYEYDFKGYFDNLKQDFMFSTMLKDFNITGRTLEILKSINKSIPELTKEDKLVEPDRQVRFTPDGAINMQAIFSDHASYNSRPTNPYLLQGYTKPQI